MLNSIEIKKFKGIENVKLEGLAQVNYLVGPNGSGKSSLLTGIISCKHLEFPNNKPLTQIDNQDWQNFFYHLGVVDLAFPNNLFKEGYFLKIEEDNTENTPPNFQIKIDGNHLKLENGGFFQQFSRDHYLTLYISGSYYSGINRSACYWTGQNVYDNHIYSGLEQDFDKEGVKKINYTYINPYFFNEPKIIEDFGRIVDKEDTIFYETLSNVGDLINKHLGLKSDIIKLKKSIHFVNFYKELSAGMKYIFIILYFSLLFANKKSIQIYLEEPENHLHPEWAKEFPKMVELIRNTIIAKYKDLNKNDNSILIPDIQFFITTHSNYIINSALELNEVGQEPTHKVFLLNNGELKTSFPSNNDIQNQTQFNREMLTDLGVQPSDLLFSNGIIWVEGPTDRIYIKKWLEIFNPALKENISYTFAYYGGKLLSHYSGEENWSESEEKDFLQLFKFNFNMFLVMDSDKKESDDGINDTKQRIIDQLGCSKTWITAGKEIENYLPKELVMDIRKEMKVDSEFEEGQFSNLLAYKANGSNKTLNKIDFAKRIVEEINKENWEENFCVNGGDLENEITKLAVEIRKWNNNS